MDKNNLTRKFIFIIIVFISIFIIGYVLNYVRGNFINYKQRRLSWDKLKESIIEKRNNFDGISAIVIKDYKYGWKIAINENKEFASASLVKLPIMLISFLGESCGEINLNEKIKLMDSQKTPGSGILKKMQAGTEFTLEQILTIMITRSDNTATNLMIEKLGMDYINNNLLSLGLSDTNLSRKMMEFDKRRNGIENYTTVKDMSFVLDKLYTTSKRNDPISKKCLELLKKQKIKDRIPAKLPEDTMVAHKTGLERYICHDIGIVFTERGDFLIAVLTKTKRGSRYAKKYIADISLEVYNYVLENN